MRPGVVVGGFPKCFICHTSGCSRPGRCNEPYIPPRWVTRPPPTGGASEAFLSDEIRRLKAALREIRDRVGFLSDTASGDVYEIATKALGEAPGA